LLLHKEEETIKNLGKKWLVALGDSDNRGSAMFGWKFWNRTET